MDGRATLGDSFSILGDNDGLSIFEDGITILGALED